MKIKITANILGVEEELLTVKQVSERLKITRQAVNKWINEGKVRSIKSTDFDTRIYLIPLSDISGVTNND